MQKRRPNGDGMVRKRTDGRWEGRIIVGRKENNSPIYRSVLDRSQKELIKKLHSIMNEYNGINVTEECNTTISEWLDTWMLNYVTPNVRDSTFLAYDNIINNYLKPRLGDMIISRIKTNDIQKFYSYLKRTELSDNYIRKIHTMFRQSLEVAKREHLIATNPTDNCKVPRKEKKDMKVLDKKQLDKFMQTINNDKLWYDFFYVEISTGLRKGELCGLKWCDFDEQNKTLTISRNITKKADGSYDAGKTKTKTGMRTIVLADSTNELLKNRKKKKYSEWIFPNLMHFDKPTNPGTAYNHLKLLLKNAGLPSIRFHDLRHTFATHALTNNVDPKTLSNILGHTNSSFTLDTYTHVTTDMQKGASKIIESVFSEIIQKEVKKDA